MKSSIRTTATPDGEFVVPHLVAGIIISTLFAQDWDGDNPSPLIAILMELGHSLVDLGRSPDEVAALYNGIAACWQDMH